MKLNGEHYRTIWIDAEDERCIHISDPRPLPHAFVVEEIRSVNEMATAIRDMHLRGAGLIGAAAAFGMYLAALEAFDSALGMFFTVGSMVEEAGHVQHGAFENAFLLTFFFHFFRRTVFALHGSIFAPGSVGEDTAAQHQAQGCHSGHPGQFFHRTP